MATGNAILRQLRSHQVEELIAENEGAISLVRVGCSHLCDKAPVAHIIIEQASGERRGSLECVDGPAQCAKVLDGALVQAGVSSQARSALSGVDGLMFRRAAGVRWEALRDLSRARDERSRRTGLARLEESIAAKLLAPGSDAGKLARTKRRAARLRERFAIAPPSPEKGPPPADIRREDNTTV
ncbi:hypothetical protein T492DRAFT_842310 [Pavlovales sp. CCMP2436]|nr:hypothetical protein T492DRAFT_842310 [Pavlovales sp. CCMP2436]